MEGRQPAADSRPDRSRATGAPESIGPYRILEVLGEGGMGVVYLAEQQKPVRRRVALKLIKTGMDTREVVARFEAERQALAMMDHPNIARVHDAGATDDGRPYFVMEHIRGVPLGEDVDHRTDVYSLGVMLYELLVGEPPLDPELLAKAGFDEILRRIREEDPPTPSTRWTRLNVERMTLLASRRDASPGELVGMFRGDLDWITMKAVEKERARRYKSASDLAEDIIRHLEGDPVEAGPPDAVYRLGKYVRKNRVFVLAASAVMVALAVGLGVSLVFFVNAQREKENAQRERESVQQQRGKAEERLADFNRVSLGVDLEEMTAATDRLWPASSAKAGELAEWIGEARKLAARRDGLRTTLDILRERALPCSDGQRRKDRELYLEAKGHAQLVERRDAARKRLAELRAAGHEPPAVTVLDHGDDPENRRPTWYFRRAFEVAEPDTVKELRAEIVFDDGVVVYLNGEEVLRRNLPDGDVVHSTPATVSLGAPVEEKGVVLEGASVVAGRNVLAVELHQGSPQSSDARLDLALAGSGGGEDGDSVTLIARGSRWRFDDGGEEPGSAWREPVFDDSAWREGPAPLGWSFGNGPQEEAEAEHAIERLEARTAALEAEDPQRRTWTFVSARDRWWHRTLVGLLDGLGSFVEATIPDVERRLEFAVSVREKTVEGEAVAAKWRQAIRRIGASKSYGVDLARRFTPQEKEGLIPLGRDESSGLEEFAHLQSGQPALRGEDGRLDVREETGIVLVLIPGGSFLMGAEKEARLGVEISEADGGLVVEKIREPSPAATLGVEPGDVLLDVNGEPVKAAAELAAALAPLAARVPLEVEFRRGGERKTLSGKFEWNVDPLAQSDEGPVHAVTLGAFFLSKHEMTQGQWERFTGTNPSIFGPGTEHGDKTTNLRHPVENVSWEDSKRELTRLGLRLPTEAQWEYAARAGSFTPWWTGNDPARLETAGNMVDQFCKENGGSPDWKYEEWNDGYTAHAPVGSFQANAFGLHDMNGNVYEWCEDIYAAGFYGTPEAAGPDPVSTAGPAGSRVYRGGCWSRGARRCRSARRDDARLSDRRSSFGFRPVRPLR